MLTVCYQGFSRNTVFRWRRCTPTIQIITLGEKSALMTYRSNFLPLGTYVRSPYSAVLTLRSSILALPLLTIKLN